MNEFYVETLGALLRATATLGIDSNSIRALASVTLDLLITLAPASYCEPGLKGHDHNISAYSRRSVNAWGVVSFACAHTIQGSQRFLASWT